MADYGNAGLQQMAGVGQLGYAQGANQALKGTAVDSVNSDIEAMANNVASMTNLARRISDGVLGVEPPKPEPAATNGPRAVRQSTQEHIKDLQTAIAQLSNQINRLG